MATLAKVPWRAVACVAGGACALLAVRHIYRRRRLLLRVDELVRSSPVFQAANLDLPGELDTWLTAGSVLVDKLAGPEGPSDQLFERVYSYYLPVYFWVKDAQRTASRGQPALVGLQCLQGGGKTTICDSLELLSRRDGLNCVVASIDDFYKTHAELLALAARHPEDPMLHGRGLPGTHDMGLMRDTIGKLRTLSAGETIKVPRYDKSAHGGQGDRAAEATWPTVRGPVDLIILEGWCFGFKSQGATVPARMRLVDSYLQDFDETYAQLDAFVVMQALRARCVYDWREEAEQMRRTRSQGAMSKEQVITFVDRYYPSYEQYLPRLYEGSPCQEAKTLRFWIDGMRRPVHRPRPTPDIFL